MQAQLAKLIPGFATGAQGSQTLTQLANRNNVSNDAIKVYAAAAQQQQAQQRELAKLQAEAIRRQQEQDEFNANVSREAQSQYEAALNSVGDERTRNTLAGNGTLSNVVAQNLQAQFQNLQASGKHVDKNGNLTFQAASLQAALGEAGRISTQDLEQNFGGDETARANATQQAERNLNAGALGNFAASTAASAGRGFLGLPLQAGAAVAGAFGDNPVARGLGRGAAAVGRAADRIDIVTPEEAAFQQQFADSEGFSGGLGTILSNPGQALQSFGPEVAGSLGAGAGVRVAGREVLRRAAPEAFEQAGSRLAQSQAARAGTTAGAFQQGAIATAPAVFAGGAGEFVRGAQGALDSETDDIGSFAQRGLATSAVGAAAGGLVNAAGLGSLDAPLLRARQASQATGTAAPAAATRLGRAAQFGGSVGGEVARGGLGEGIQEGIEGAAQSVSQQVGEGSTLAELDLGRVQADAGRGAAAGLTLGAGTSAVTGTGSTVRRRQNEETLRARLQSATGRGGPAGIAPLRESLSNLDDSVISTTINTLQTATPEERQNFVLGVAQDLNIQSADITAEQVESLLPNSVDAEGLIDAGLLRSNIGRLLGTELTTDEAGTTIRAPELEAAPAATPDASTTPVADAILGGDTGAELNGELDLDNTALDSLGDANEQTTPAAEPVVEQNTLDIAPAQPEPEPIQNAGEAEPQGIRNQLTDAVLSDEIEATFANIPNVSRANRDNDGSPLAVANADFQTALVRNQIARGLREPGDTRPSGQLEIQSRLDELAAEQGLTDPAEIKAFQDAQREDVAEGFRAFREQEIQRRSEGLPPVPEAEPVVETAEQVEERASSFARQEGELNVIVNDADPDNALLPEVLRTVMIGSAPPATRKRGVAGLAFKSDERNAFEAQFLQPTDLQNADKITAANKIIDGIRKKIGNVYKISALDLRTGDGRVPIKKKGTPASRAESIKTLQAEVSKDLQAVQALMTPEGFQRVFGKKL